MILLALDLEMNQPSGKIIEIGAVIGDTTTGKIIDRFTQLVNPNERLSQYIIGLTGITQDDIDLGSVPLWEAFRRLRLFHKKHDAFCNPLTWGGGDSEELKKQLKEESGQWPEGESWPFGRRWIDAKTLYVSWRIANEKPIQGGLAKAMTNFKLKFHGKKHRAEDDAFNTFVIYLALLRQIKGDSNGEKT